MGRPKMSNDAFLQALVDTDVRLQMYGFDPETVCDLSDDQVDQIAWAHARLFKGPARATKRRGRTSKNARREYREKLRRLPIVRRSMRNLAYATAMSVILPVRFMRSRLGESSFTERILPARPV